jgi:DNA polymerase-3 subunit delta'
MAENKLDEGPVIASAEAWQDDVIQELCGLKQKGQLPHAVLIGLQTGVNSRSFGWQLVTALLCQISDAQGPCGQCDHCHLMQANNYPDFTFTTLLPNERTGKISKDIKVEQIRRLIHQLTLTPNRQSGKVALIYPAEKMNQSAANSLLKTLEEPADEVTIILLSHHVNRLPITVRSRCQQWLIRNPPMRIAQSWLQASGMDPEQIDISLSLTQGDVQMALQLQQQDCLQYAQQFSLGFDDFIEDKQSVIPLVTLLKKVSNETLRLIVHNALLDHIYRQLDQDLSAETKTTLAELLELKKQAQTILRIEENNLNLQLQLEDVLISLKQILKRDTHHAFT